MKCTRIGTLLCVTIVGLTAASETSNSDWVEIYATDPEGELETDPLTGETTALNGVTIRYREASLQARRVFYDPENWLVEAEGDVLIETTVDGRSQIWRSEAAKYNFQTGELETGAFRVGQPPLFVSGEALITESDGTYRVLDGLITTDDTADPAYKIRSRRISVDPGKQVRAEKATVYAGPVPVFYWPQYTRPIQPKDRYWRALPGYRSIFGPFLLSTYHWNVNPNLETGMRLDWRQRRGFAGGPQVAYDLGDWGQGDAQFYFAHDKDPTINAFDIPVVSDRYRLQLRHSYANDSGLSVKLRVEDQNDALVMRDFFEADFRRDLQPRSFLGINQLWDNWTFDVQVQPQLNSFFQTIERLPDLKLTGLRQQLGDTPVYYDSESSLAYLRFRAGLLGGTNYAGLRGDTYHQLTVPKTYFGWLNVLPRVGARYTYYGDPEGLNTIQQDHSRFVFNTGAEINTKISRVWTQPKSRLFDVDGLRHIIQPSINYVFVPEPNVRPNQLPQYDFDWVTPRLLPIEFPDYNNIDSIDSQNAIRWALRNRLQTKRDGQVVDLVHWALYTDWRLRTRPGQTTFPDIFSDLDFSPTRWMLLNSQVRYDIHQKQWREANHRMTLLPSDRWNWTIGHRYLRTDPSLYGLGNNLLFSSFYYKLNENWGMRATHFMEMRDGVLEEQTYAVYRDLRSWTAMLGLRMRENRFGDNDWALVFTMQLKAFPIWKLDEDRDLPERMFGG